MIDATLEIRRLNDSFRRSPSDGGKGFEPSTPWQGCASAKSQQRGLNFSLRQKFLEPVLAGPTRSAGLPIAQDGFLLAFDGRQSL